MIFFLFLKKGYIYNISLHVSQFYSLHPFRFTQQFPAQPLIIHLSISIKISPKSINQSVNFQFLNIYTFFVNFLNNYTFCKKKKNLRTSFQKYTHGLQYASLDLEHNWITHMIKVNLAIEMIKPLNAHNAFANA